MGGKEIENKQWGNDAYASNEGVEYRRDMPDITPYSTERRMMPTHTIGTRASLNAEGKSSPVTLRRMAWGTKEKYEMTAIYTSTVAMLKRNATRLR